MAELPSQYADDDLLNVQLEARERASREDAALHVHRRGQAAARALGLPPPADPVVVDGFEDIPPDPPAGAEVDEVDEATAPAVEPDPEMTLDAPPLEPMEPEVSGPGEGIVDWHAPAARAVVPPDIQVPRAGPAAVTTGVLAAAAAQKPKPERPLLELRPTALATEIDRIGDQLVVMTDRIELRDRHGGLRRQLAHADIEDVTVERRLTSAVLNVRSRTAGDMVVKGLRPDLAEEAQAAIRALLPEVAVINSIEEKALMHSILALHRAGVLNDQELSSKTAFVARMAGH